jgi:translation initiation factor IF-3
VNERIRVPQVRVIGEAGEQVGVLSTQEALDMARARGLDLVEVAGNVRPPVCRILDYGKYKYEQNRKARQARKRQHQTQVKEIKMRPKIDAHDYGFKLDHAREFLQERDKVKLTVMFRGREMAHPENGYKLIQRVIADLADYSLVETPPRTEGRTITAVLSPKATRSSGPKKAVATKERPNETGPGGNSAASGPVAS